MVININDVSCQYVSCACNCTPHSADWGNNGVICYGACNSIAIYDPEDGGGGRVTRTLCAHKGRVNSVRWVRKSNSQPETEIVSASTDHLVIVWSFCGDKFCPTSVLKGHESSVTVVDAAYRGTTLTVASASVDSTIRIWERESGKDGVCVGIINLNSGLALSLRLVVLENSQNVLLACGTDDCKIQLYSKESGEVVKLDSLAGHEDWVRSLDFTKDDSGDLLLASGSQDATVRLWRFQTVVKNREDESVFRLEEQILSVSTDVKLAVRLEAVLSGHYGWVYGVHWHPSVKSDDGNKIQPLQLLSVSMDKTVIIWSPEQESGVWLEDVRVGEVGGNTLGFYGGFFGPGGNSILVHGFQGGFHMWRKSKDGWSPSVTVGGHFDAVSDIGWELQRGRYLISVSNDQTTRLHAKWLQKDCKKDSWHEIARPQVHGYGLVCLTVLPGYRFASGADEKVVRTFVAPQNFLENFKRLCVSHSTIETEMEEPNLPRGAAVPVLGLSNKAVFQDEESVKVQEEKHIKDQYDDAYFVPQELTEPPTEENLMQNTLWPEVMKLYGHGYEIYSLASTSDGKLLASACKATSTEHAAILLWDTQSWVIVGKLLSHQLTVTQMAFSPDDQFLLSVSRDRKWSIFQKQDVPADGDKYKLVATTDKSTGLHTRIIWCCCWTHDSKYFATGSREGKVVVWGRTGQNHPVLGEFGAVGELLDTSGDSVTSIAFSSLFVLGNDGEYLCAVGMDSGQIRLYGWRTSWRQLYQISPDYGHHLTVKRLAFCPYQSNNIVQLASCGLDHMVKVYDIHLNKV